MALGFYSYTCAIDASNQWIGNTTSLDVITNSTDSTPVPSNSTIINVVTVGASKWWLGVIITLVIIIPVFGVGICWFRKKHQVEHRQSVVKRRGDDPGFENVDR
jgi:hypothetical protein